MIDEEQQILKNVIAAKGCCSLKTLNGLLQPKISAFYSAPLLEKVIPLEQFKGDIAAKYEEVFGKCRNPGGLLTYAAGLKTLEDPTLLPCLGQYVVSVMDETFKTNVMRQQTILIWPKSRGKSRFIGQWKEEMQMDVQTIISGD